MPATVETNEEKVALRNFYHNVRDLVASGMMQRDILAVFVQAINDDAFNVGVADAQPIKVEPDEQDSVADDKSDSGLSSDLSTHDTEEAEMNEAHQCGKAKYRTSAASVSTPTKPSTPPKLRTVAKGPTTAAKRVGSATRPSAKRQSVATHDDQLDCDEVVVGKKKGTPKGTPKGKGKGFK